MKTGVNHPNPKSTYLTVGEGHHQNTNWSFKNPNSHSMWWLQSTNKVIIQKILQNHSELYHTGSTSMPRTQDIKHLITLMIWYPWWQNYYDSFINIHVPIYTEKVQQNHKSRVNLLKTPVQHTQYLGSWDRSFWVWGQHGKFQGS